MLLRFCADRPSSDELAQPRLQHELLEDRRLLSVSQLGEADLRFQFDVLAPSYLTNQPYASVKFGVRVPRNSERTLSAPKF